MAAFLPVDFALRSLPPLNKDFFKLTTGETFMKALNSELHEANNALKAHLQEAYECRDFKRVDELRLRMGKVHTFIIDQELLNKSALEDLFKITRVLHWNF